MAFYLLTTVLTSVGQNKPVQGMFTILFSSVQDDYISPLSIIVNATIRLIKQYPTRVSSTLIWRGKIAPLQKKYFWHWMSQYFCLKRTSRLIPPRTSQQRSCFFPSLKDPKSFVQWWPFFIYDDLHGNQNFLFIALYQLTCFYKNM